MSEKPNHAGIFFAILVVMFVGAYVLGKLGDRLDRIEAHVGLSQQEPAR